ncbi:hypothetical protein Y1Q_0024513 [Alligator mississippiensis]|uniref:Uncharacterized protein n=1 Tax=Alligator mississippiensis TaxID=8496 RepID=A0A151NAR0_ALLMI|nr:hypothetical protein Y1Q_0024513 [Alligator mississippiensis]
MMKRQLSKEQIWQMYSGGVVLKGLADRKDFTVASQQPEFRLQTLGIDSSVTHEAYFNIWHCLVIDSKCVTRRETR